MKRIAITGPIGAGKSFVSQMLRNRNFKVLDADSEVHKLYKNCKDLREELKHTFGESCLTEEGVNRKFFSNLIFTNKLMRKKLEMIVYPYLIKRIKNFFEENQTQTCFVEAAVLENILEILEFIDELWLVQAPDCVRLSRLINRGMNRDDALQRMESQRENFKFLKDVKKPVIEIKNKGSEEPLLPLT